MALRYHPLMPTVVSRSSNEAVLASQLPDNRCATIFSSISKALANAFMTIFSETPDPETTGDQFIEHKHCSLVSFATCLNVGFSFLVCFIL